MFAAVINSTKSALAHVILKYVARASVAIPFVLALGFILAAIATMLVERFGNMGGYWIMSGALVALGAIAAVAVSVRERRAENGEGGGLNPRNHDKRGANRPVGAQPLR